MACSNMPRLFESSMEKPVNPDRLPVVDLDKLPRVELELMNDVHREEIALVNALGEQLLTGADGLTDDAAISQCLAAWISHTQEHFEGENRLMQIHGFPPFPVHKGEHDQMLTQLSQIERTWQQDRDAAALAEFLYETWLPWFDTHVKTMDTVTAGFLNRVMQS